jgi:hypothetical protein
VRRIPVQLVLSLIALSLVGLGVGFLLDTFPHGWLTDHPTTANIVAGILAVPLTLLAALFLVDYFVERAEKLRTEPARRALLDQIEHHAESIMRSATAGLFGGIGPESTRFDGTSYPWWPQELALMRVRFIAGDFPSDWVVLEDAPPSPPKGWVPFPDVTAVEDPIPRSTPRPRHLVETAESSSALLDLVAAYGEVTDDKHLTAWTLIMKGRVSDLSTKVAETVKALEDDEQWHIVWLSDVKKKGNVLPSVIWRTCEAVASLMVYLGLVPEKDWPKGAGDAPDFSLKKR